MICFKLSPSWSQSLTARFAFIKMKIMWRVFAVALHICHSFAKRGHVDPDHLGSFGSAGQYPAIPSSISDDSLVIVPQSIVGAN